MKRRRTLVHWIVGVIFAITLLGQAGGRVLAIPAEDFIELKEVAVNPVTNRVYVTGTSDLDPFSKRLFVFDGATQKLITSIQVAADYVAVNPTTNRIYVTSTLLSTVFIYDGNTNVSVGFVNLGAQGTARGIAVNPVTNRIYVANSTTDPPAGSMSVIDGATKTLLTEVFIPGTLWNIAVNPVTNRIYVASANFVAVFNGATNAAVGAILGGAGSIGINPVTNRIYVEKSGTISVINGANHSVIGTIDLGDAASRVDVNPITNRIYASIYNDDVLLVISGASNNIIDSVGTGGYPWGVGVNSITNRIYVGNYDDSPSNVSVIYGNELLRNSSFDDPSPSSDPPVCAPLEWTSYFACAQFDYTHVNVYEGKRSIYLEGAPYIQRISQTRHFLGNFLFPGSVLTLEGWSKSEGAAFRGPATYRVTAQVRFVDDTTESFGIFFSGGTHDWERKVAQFTLPKTAKAVTVTVDYSLQTGTAWFDALHLTRVLTRVPGP